MSAPYRAQDVPTLYFIGVTTSRSSIMRVFPRWAQVLGIDARIEGVDFALHDRPEHYREIVRHIKGDPHSMGALVTTHKLDLLNAAKDLFDEFGPYAKELAEISCISKRNGTLVGKAMDPITSGLALDAFVPEAQWASGPEVLILGAGGASLALTVNLLERAKAGKPHPARIIVSNRSQPRLDEMESIHNRMDVDLPLEYVLSPTADGNDRLCDTLPSGSIVINATGLGKDRPGSPLSDRAAFPQGGRVWDFNYRGDLLFLEQARRQEQARDLVIEDGWTYFIHGWTRVVSEVFQLDLPTAGPMFQRLSDEAALTRTSAKKGSQT